MPMNNKLLSGAALILSLGIGAALAQQPPAPANGPAPVGTRPAGGGMPAPARGPSLELALEAAQTAVALCHAQNHDAAVVVADSAGGIKVALVPDGKPTTLTTFAQRKIATVLEFKQNSADVQALAKTDKTVADKIAANSNLFAVPGAVLLKVGDEIVGVIAGSGAKSEEDAACAQAGADKIKTRLK